MGHAVHFLQRLSRVNDEHLERALGIYRSSSVLREVLDQLGLPEGAERLAVSVGDDRRGPFVILGRDGGFITCLAEDMHVGDTPIVPRARFELVTRHAKFLREDMQRIAEFARTHSAAEINLLAHRLSRGAARFSREDAACVEGVLGFFIFNIMDSLAHYTARAEERLRELHDARRKKRISHALYNEQNKRFEIGVWSMANMAPFLGVDQCWGPRLVECLKDTSELRLGIARECFGWGSGLHAYRAIWLALQTGELGHQRMRSAREPDDLAGREFQQLVVAAFEARAQPRPDNQQTHSIAHEIANAAELCPSGPWFSSPRRAQHLARISANLGPLAHARLQDLYLPRAELPAAVLRAKPQLERWLHMAPAPAASARPRTALA